MLIHFDQPISDHHTCQHYLGYTSKSIRKQMLDHLAGRGARLTQVAKQRGISFRVVRIWRNGSPQLERQLKNRKDGPKLCPICNKEIKSFIPYRRKIG